MSGDWQNVKLVINHNTCLTGGERQDESGGNKDRLGLKDLNKITIMWIVCSTMCLEFKSLMHLRMQPVVNKEALKAPCGCL